MGEEAFGFQQDALVEELFGAQAGGGGGGAGEGAGAGVVAEGAGAVGDVVVAGVVVFDGVAVAAEDRVVGALRVGLPSAVRVQGPPDVSSVAMTKPVRWAFRPLGAGRFPRRRRSTQL
ncbi:hypothetical protein ACIRYZ_42115 [Kitasatospora sp. NPDC101155]|uniref:hypothetical protein n=1 Tax=Kitasatospora sp. NPDC101155 TaxID=3364097 RepID=UPI0038115036